MSKKCDGCVYFLKMKSLGMTRALCEFWDSRISSSTSGKKCPGFTRPKYSRKKAKIRIRY